MHPKMVVGRPEKVTVALDHLKDAGAHIVQYLKAKVFFVSPKDETVTSPLKIQMGIEGMEVQPAGKKRRTGHHHIIIDADPSQRNVGARR